MLLYDISRPGPPGGKLPSPLDNSCDLALFGELGNKDRGVLVVSLRLQFKFRRTKPEDGLPYTWASGEKEAFVHDATLAIKRVWDDRFRITTSSTVPDKAFRDIGVIVSPTIQIGGLSFEEDFEIKIKKVGGVGEDGSHINHKKRTGQLDNRGATPRSHTTPTGVQVYQTPVAHEFSHMLGLRDEYPEAKRNLNWPKDWGSILHSGDAVRPRHYVPFAMWLNQTFAAQSQRAGVATAFKVDGGRQDMWDETNALL
jgi:hypothetical protein